MKMGDIIKQLRLEKGLTQEELGNIVNVKKAAVQKWESGQTKNLKRSVILKLSEFFGVTPSYLMGMQEEDLKGEYLIKEDTVEYVPRKIIMLPIVGVVRAGQPILATENIEGRFPIDESFIKKDKSYFFLRVKGDSMNLEFKEGSLLLIEKTPYVENGEIGVVMVNGDEATVKKIIRKDDMMTLMPMSNNPNHTPQMINLNKQEVRIIGKVSMSIKQY